MRPRPAAHRRRASTCGAATVTSPHPCDAAPFRYVRRLYYIRARPNHHPHRRRHTVFTHQMGRRSPDLARERGGERSLRPSGSDHAHDKEPSLKVARRWGRQPTRARGAVRVRTLSFAPTPPMSVYSRPTPERGRLDDEGVPERQRWCSSSSRRQGSPGLDLHDRPLGESATISWRAPDPSARRACGWRRRAPEGPGC